MAADYTRRAYELRDRTSEPEKYFISANFHIVVTGSMENAQQACDLWIRAYPRAEIPRSFLSSLIYPVLGRYEKAVEEGREAIRLSPDSPISYAILMFSYIALNRLDEAKATYHQALERKLNNSFLHIALYQIAFLQNDAAVMTQQVAWSVGKPGVEDELLNYEADTAAFSGRMRKARDFSRRAMDSAVRAEQKEAAATYSAMAGLREALFNNPDEARRKVGLVMGRTSGLRDKNGKDACRFVLVGFEALFEFLPTPIAVFACDNVLGVGKPCRTLSSFAIQRIMPSECGGIPSSQVIQQFSRFLAYIFKFSLGG